MNECAGLTRAEVVGCAIIDAMMTGGLLYLKEKADGKLVPTWSVNAAEQIGHLVLDMHREFTCEVKRDRQRAQASEAARN